MSDNCGVASLVSNAPTQFPVGTNLVTWTATDVNGNTATCAQLVVVVDTQPPAITCPPNITVAATPGQSSSNVVFTFIATDNCTIASLVSVPASGSAFPIGTTAVTNTATDLSGNSSSCTFNVTVNAAPPVNQPPVVNAGSDQTITLPAGASLSGSASDDGLPVPPGALTLQWLQVSGPGVVTFGDATAANTTASFSLPGIYDLELKADDSQLLASADVFITVNPVPNLPPSITLTNPVDGAVFTPPADIARAADASDADGTVAKVDFYAGTTLLGTANASPFAFSWNGVGSGSFALTAVATDDRGATSTSGVVNVTVSYAPPPANDDFSNAQVLTGSSGSVIGENANATSEPGEPFHAGNFGGSSVWYQWTAGISSQTLVDTLGSDFDTLLGVYVGTGVSFLNLVGSNNNIDPSTPQSRLSFTSIAGTTYYFAVDGFNGAQGNIVLNWVQTGGPPPPFNDGFATAQVVTGTFGSLTSSTTGATKEPGEPNHAGNPGGASVWYEWTAPTDNMTTFDTLGSPFNTLLGIYTGDSVAALTEVASNDNYVPGSTPQSRVRFQAYAGTNYFIAVDGTNGASGTLVLTWNQEGLGNLPDLTVVPSGVIFTNETFISTDCAVVEGLVQAGTRRLMLFTIRTRNQGPIDWFIGNPAGNPAFVWAPCHAHYHYNNFMQYRLLDSNGQLVAPGYKVGFCISDSIRWDSTANSHPKYSCSTQGVQKGWDDIYASHTTGQWIDITGVPDGYYTFTATVNPLQLVQESNYNNNTASLAVILGTPAPPNDNFANAQTISGLTGQVIGLNKFGSKETGEPNHAGNAGGKSIWYAWTAVNDDSVIFDTKNNLYNNNTLLAAYTGSAVDSLTTVASNDDIGGVYASITSRIAFKPTAGATYYIAVDGYNGASFTNVLNWIQTPPPANDNFANAQIITGGVGSAGGTNVLATKESGEPRHAGNAGGHSLWYLWTAPATGTVTIDTVGSEFDTLLAVYTGSAYGALTTIASNDDMGGSGNTKVWSQVSFTATQGTDYRIALDGYNNKQGITVLNWNQPNAALGSVANHHPGHYSLAVVQEPAEISLTCTALPTGGILLGVDGAPKQYCTIQFSADLKNWTTLIDFALDDFGRGVLVDRAKIEGRPNINDPWCGDARTGIYVPPVKQGEAVYYRAVAETPTSTPLLK
ncbi:MAG: HYR domain-containing protein [Verrucomicrobia bacterium]|nr:HYR domain-containing protein [Verrucomicrobiota bacterium]